MRLLQQRGDAQAAGGVLLTQKLILTQRKLQGMRLAQHDALLRQQIAHGVDGLGRVQVRRIGVVNQPVGIHDGTVVRHGALLWKDGGELRTCGLGNRPRCLRRRLLLRRGLKCRGAQHRQHKGSKPAVWGTATQGTSSLSRRPGPFAVEEWGVLACIPVRAAAAAGSESRYFRVNRASILGSEWSGCPTFIAFFAIKVGSGLHSHAGT